MKKSLLLSECRDILVEAIFNHRWTLLEGYHAVGMVMIENNLSVLEVAHSTKQLPKTIHFCRELARKYPDLNSLPEGKNVSWYKITKTLPQYGPDKGNKKRTLQGSKV